MSRSSPWPDSDYDAHILCPPHYLLDDHGARVDARNDSQVIFYDAILPGSTLLGYLNADHWAVAVPIARTHPTVGAWFVTENAYPREALLETILRFVEEDLDSFGR